jgi:hypothetical protein
MSLYDLEQARPLGSGGKLTPLGCITDLELADLVGRYKRNVARRHRAMGPDEISTRLQPGRMFVSRKVDGALWFLVAAAGDIFLCSHTGRVIAKKVPLLDEAQKLLPDRVAGRTVICGELFAAVKEGRPRAGDLTMALGGEADAAVGRIGFAAFDLAQGGDAQQPEPDPSYAGRLEALKRLLAGGKRLQVVKTEEVDRPGEVARLYAEWVEQAGSEGLVVRTEDGRGHKVKPFFTLDAVVIGFTERADREGQTRSLLLAVVREEGQFQIVGSVGNLGDEEHRRAVLERLAPTVVESRYRFASSSGALYRFVRPEMVVEVRVTDLLGEDISGRPIKKMVLELRDGGWVPLRAFPGVSLVHPRLERVRDDKQVNATDVRASQLLDRCPLQDLEVHAEALEVPKSELLRREVYTKTTKGKLAVRKLLVWKTNKEQVEDLWPAYVVHFTDYSPGRKDPLKREVRLAPSAALAEEIAERMLADNIKKGWVRA